MAKLRYTAKQQRRLDPAFLASMEARFPGITSKRGHRTTYQALAQGFVQNPALGPFPQAVGLGPSIHFPGGSADSPLGFVNSALAAANAAYRRTITMPSFGNNALSFGFGGGGGWAPSGGGGFGTTNWGDVLLQGLNVGLSYKAAKEQAKAMRRMYGGGGGFMIQQPNLGGGLMLAPPSGDIFGGGAPTVPVPAVPGSSTPAPFVGAAIRGGAALLKVLAKYVGPAAAVELAANLMSDGVTAGGPYRTEAANRAIAYRGDLAACKRLRAAGKAIGYARATGMRRSVRRGRRC